MDRFNFLSTLPFLFKLPTDEWYPNGFDDTEHVYCLEDHHCGIEPVDPETQESLGPVFFYCQFPNEINQSVVARDPAAASVSMVITKKAISSLRFHYFAFLCIDNGVYQLDLNDIKELELFDREEGDGVEKKSTPPCLLIRFSNCYFRFFSFTSFALNEIRSKPLSECKESIVEARRWTCPFVARDMIIMCRMGNSIAATGEPRYKKVRRCASEPGQEESLLSYQEQDVVSDDIASTGEQCYEKAKRCVASLNSVHEDLSFVQELSTRPVQSGTESERKDMIVTKLEAVADNVSSSFISQDERYRAQLEITRRIVDRGHQIEMVLDKVWGPKRNGRQFIQVPVSESEKQGAIAAVESLQCDIKRGFEERWNVNKLPTRG